MLCRRIDKGNKKLEEAILTIWNEVFTGIKHYMKKINHECETFSECKGLPECEEFGKIKFNYSEHFDRIEFISNDNLPIGNLIYFSTITVTIRNAFKKEDFLSSSLFR